MISWSQNNSSRFCSKLLPSMQQMKNFTLHSNFCRTQVIFSVLQYCKHIHFYITFCKKHHFASPRSAKRNSPQHEHQCLNICICSQLHSLLLTPSYCTMSQLWFCGDNTDQSISDTISGSFATTNLLHCFSNINQQLFQWQSHKYYKMCLLCWILSPCLPDPGITHRSSQNPPSERRSSFFHETLKIFCFPPAVVQDWKCNWDATRCVILLSKSYHWKW